MLHFSGKKMEFFVLSLPGGTITNAVTLSASHTAHETIFTALRYSPAQQ